jgi:hypothetical protein
LYEYACGDLSERDREEIEEHLAVCQACTADLDVIRAAIAMLPRPARAPSEQRDQAFWAGFASRVEREISARSRRSLLGTLHDHIVSFVTFNQTPLLAGTGTLAVIALAVVLLWPHSAPAPAPSKTEEALLPAVIREPAAQRMNQYLKRSKILLVGLSNLKTEGVDPVDLTMERRQSRELVHEARYLQQQPLDARSAKLVGDLEKILIELANIGEERHMPNVEIIRTGIRRENLLFKIRMTESLLEAGATERSTQ